MGTKNNPSAFDCYAAAEPDEPMFVLLGRDPSACVLVAMWAAVRQKMGEDPAKIIEALACADALAAWSKKLGKKEKIEAVIDAFEALAESGTDLPAWVEKTRGSAG